MEPDTKYVAYACYVKEATDGSAKIVGKISAREFRTTPAYTLNGEFTVSGKAMSHLIDSVNFDDEESMNWFHRTLRRMGVIDALREAGAVEGSTVYIEDMSFDFID